MIGDTADRSVPGRGVHQHEEQVRLLRGVGLPKSCVPMLTEKPAAFVSHQPLENWVVAPPTVTDAVAGPQ